MNDMNLDLLRLITTVCVQIVVVLFTFKLLIKKRDAFLVLLLCLVFNIGLDYFLVKLGNSFLLALQLDTLLFCFVIIFISAGNIYGQVFFHYFQNLVANCFYIIGAQFLVFGKRTEFLVTEFLLVLYLILMLWKGKEVISSVRDFLNKASWRVLLLYPLGSYYVIRLFGFETEIALYAPNTPLVLALSLLAGNLMAIISIVLLRKKTEMEFELLQGKMALSASEGYYQKLSEMLEEIRIIRHDYKHEIGAMQELVKNNAIEELNKFLKLPTLIGSSETLYCKNIVVNALLSHYVSICKNNKVDVHICANLPCLELEEGIATKNKPTNHDLCIIVGNLFENAIEASLKLGENKRKIEIDIESDEQKILFKVKNNCIDEFEKENQLLPSSDKNEPLHGFGLKSVNSVCEKFDGTFFWNCENDVFTARAIVSL